MSTYLLTWNPGRLPNDYLKEVAAKLQREESVEDQWSCGNNKSIRQGDRVFLLRQGHDSPGIVGSGWVTRASFRAGHWDAKKREKGLKAWYVLVEWDALVSADNGLPRATLLAGVLPESLLSVRSSGVTIEDEFAGRLEERWAVRRKAPLPVAPLVLGAIAAWEGEPVEHRGYRRKRDQRLKRAALDAAKGSCAVCATDYSNVLDGKGVRVLQVHHKKQLGQNDAPRLNTINDLAVVCANCHALIHMNAKKALTIEVLKSLLKEAR